MNETIIHKTKYLGFVNELQVGQNKAEQSFEKIEKQEKWEKQEKYDKTRKKRKEKAHLADGAHTNNYNIVYDNHNDVQS